MTVSYGFYNSINHDRVYDAEEFSSFLDGIVYDGVYQAVGDKFVVRAKSGMSLTVGSGRAWFDHTWTLNDAEILITIPTADTVYPRIDAVVLEVNKTDRRNYIKVLKGTAKSSPGKPALTKTEYIKQYPLAYITVPKNATKIVDSNITQAVDTQETPLCSALSLAGIPSGGKTGQVLAKKSSLSGAVGWYDIDKLPYDSWYLADGITENNVLAAYKFYKVGSEARALRPVNEKNNYILSKVNSPAWNNDYGFSFTEYTGLNNTNLYMAKALTVIFRIEIDKSSKMPMVAPVRFKDGDKDGSYRCVFAMGAYSYEKGHKYVECPGSCNATITEGTVNEPTTGWSNGGGAIWLTDTVMPNSGILGASFKNISSLADIYLDGLPLRRDTSSWQAKDYNAQIGVGACNTLVNNLIGGNGPVNATNPEIRNKPFKISHIVFYNSYLSADQHQQIYTQMNSDYLSS